jgi:hypothetical protein
MKKIIRLTESDLIRLVKRVISEQDNQNPMTPRERDYQNITNNPPSGAVIRNWKESNDPAYQVSEAITFSSPDEAITLTPFQIQDLINSGTVINVTNRVRALGNSKNRNFGNDLFLYYTGNGKYPGQKTEEKHIINLNPALNGTHSGIMNWRRIFPGK